MSNSFVPRDWQERFVREYQTKTKKNFLLEACTSAGKTAGALNCYVSLKSSLDWHFLISVVPSEHLKRQYATDANELFGLNLYYSGTSKRLGRLPTPQELIKQGYHGLVLSYQWLTKSGNAESLKQTLEGNLAKKIFLILDEVHHASDELAFGQACETAFPDHIVSHRLMTSGTPFRSDQNKILGNWVEYQQIEENVYQCVPDFRYTLANALVDEVIPVFSFVTLEGEFSFRRGEAHYDGITFTTAQNEQQLTDALNTAIYVEGGWVEEAINWAYERMKRDRDRGMPECATYVRVPRIDTARQMQERIQRLTGDRVLVVVSKDDDPNGNNNLPSREDSSKQIEQFAKETGFGATPWIIGVGMLGEGVSINRLKYRIHATNIRAPLSFIQDLGRLLRKFPKDKPEPVETLIPAHSQLIQLALDVMNEVAHVVEIQEENNQTPPESTDETEEGETTNINGVFQPLSSTGEFGSQIVDGQEIEELYTIVAEWAFSNHPLGKGWGKTVAHLAQVLKEDNNSFEFLYNQYQEHDQSSNDKNDSNTNTHNVPDGFPSDYGTWLKADKDKEASKQVSTKVKRLAFLLYPNVSNQEIAERIKEIHTIAKQRNGVSLNGYIGHVEYERIYSWLIDRIAHAQSLKGTEDL